jgi:transposase InsO family protein
MKLYMEYLFAGSWMLRDMLKQEGHAIGRKHVQSLMKKMGIEALYRKPNTSRRQAAHPIYPYLLRNLTIDRPNQVWATDITYIPMRRGFRLSGGHRRLVQPPCVGLADFQYADHGLLHRCASGGDRLLWNARDIQYRPGQPIHKRRVRRRAQGK